MIEKRSRRASGSLGLLTVPVFAALLLVAPAHAARQETNVSGDCNSTSVSQSSEGGSSVTQSNYASSDGDSCAIQQSNRSAGGDVSQTQIIRQRRTSDDDGDGRRTHRHRDRGADDERTDESSDDDFNATGTDELNCEDFSSQSDAQAELDEDSSDPHNLDADSDGRACEDSFGESVSSAGTPRSGIETGGGGTLHPELAHANTEPDIPVLGPALAAVLAVVLVVVGVSGLRRSRRH